VRKRPVVVVAALVGSDTEAARRAKTRTAVTFELKPALQSALSYLYLSRSVKKDCLSSDWDSRIPFGDRSGRSCLSWGLPCASRSCSLFPQCHRDTSPL